MSVPEKRGRTQLNLLVPLRCSLVSVILFAAFCFSPHPARGDNCTDEERNELLREIVEETQEDNKTVKVTCDVDLGDASEEMVTKILIFEGSQSSDLTFDCRDKEINAGRGSTNYGIDNIQIRSRKIASNISGSVWDVPENITIRNCNIVGSIRIFGMSARGEIENSFGAEDLRNASYSAESAYIFRKNAPSFIRVIESRITAVGRSSIYLTPGVHHFELIDSILDGKTDSVAIYIDHDACCNEFRNNKFLVETSERSIVAVDATDDNTFVNNYFEFLHNGGIYLYRNCGERSVVRHTNPARNHIINNIFYYDKHDGSSPSVYLGSRAGFTRKGTTKDCDLDEGYPFGSSITDVDFARENVVAQNQIFKLPVSKMIRSRIIVRFTPHGNEFRDSVLNSSPNFVQYNVTVDQDSVDMNRRAGCYVQDGYGTNFLFDGEEIEVFLDPREGPSHFGFSLRCDDGRLSRVDEEAESESSILFDCFAESNNAGCAKIVNCPDGEVAANVGAACNLEYGLIDKDDYEALESVVKVVRSSDHVNSGVCAVGQTEFSIGQQSVSGVLGETGVRVGCREHDENGGDCHIKGRLTCTQSPLADLVVGPNDSGVLCGQNTGIIVARVSNIGSKIAGPVSAEVDFFEHGAERAEIASLEADGGLEELEFRAPEVCFDQVCEFRISVDANMSIEERREDNNSITGTCTRVQ